MICAATPRRDTDFVQSSESRMARKMGSDSHSRRDPAHVCTSALTISPVQLEVEGLRPKRKEALYDCAGESRANKAALYHFAGTNTPEVVTEDVGRCRTR